MKWEGRQHGVVRTWMTHPSLCSPRPTNHFVNRLDSIPGFGEFVKVPSKPTNHSKFTGKCDRSKCINCHVSPATRSADKSKGRRNQQATTWWAEDKLDRFMGSDSFSAKSILDTLCGEDYDDHMYDHDYEYTSR
ncbi:unnamed protein product [Thlaspi arvense]|uniref:Uncharacterized protein n=1 Tax=Thlaspi arvense TaxID=13288 RepID=A0AAU9RUB8_THLAR|nr:unnamed protein product [Thlaspi arvense]